MRITTDMIAIAGLVIALITGVVISAPLELLTGIVGALGGYIGKATTQPRSDDRSRGESAIAAGATPEIIKGGDTK